MIGCGGYAAILGNKSINHLTASHTCRCKSFAIVETLYSIDAEHGIAQPRMQFPENRLAETCRNAF